MSSEDYFITKRIENRIFYYSIILLVFLYWFFYYTVDKTLFLALDCLILFLIILGKFWVEKKNGFTTNEIVLYMLLFLIPFFLWIGIILFSNDFSFTFFIPFYSLVGIKHHHNIMLFLLYFLIILLKLVVTKIYFSRNTKILQRGEGDAIFQYFTYNLTNKKLSYLIILFPLSAFIEELIYRTLLLSIFSYFLNWNYILSIPVISVIFGLVHYSTSRNWSHVVSTLISSIIYSLALIQLGLLYPWIFHLSTNLFVLLFYYQGRKKIK